MKRFIDLIFYFSPTSMANVELKWAKEVKHFCKNVPIILVANKIDIRTDPELLKQLEKEKIVSYKQNMGG